jgi:hypothetical protein
VRVATRDPSLRPYRIAVYVAYSVIALVSCTLIFRSVVTDLFGRGPQAQARPATPAACLDDADRLFAAISARAAQPAPRGLDSEALALEWDRWSRRWEDDLAEATSRCGRAEGPARDHLSTALDDLENLRREIGRSGQETSAAALRVKDELAAARLAVQQK